MQKLTILLLMAVVMISCEENKDLNVTLNESGTLKVKVLDEAGEGIGDAKVEVSTVIGASGQVVFEDSTNSSGVCETGKLLQDEYVCRVTAQVDKRVYRTEAYTQVIAGENKTVEAYPIANSGKITATVVNMEEEPLEDVNVAVLPFYHEANLTYEEMVEKRWYNSSTDANGDVTFTKVPAFEQYGRSYSFFVYYDEENYDYPFDDVNLLSGEHKEITLQVDLQ